MLILHLSLENGSLYLWAEKSLAEPPQKTPRRGRQPKNPPPQAHPFAADKEDLIQKLSPFVEIRKNPLIKSLIWLPTYKDLPLPSRPVLRLNAPEKEESSSSLPLRPWAVWSYPLTQEEGLALLKMTKNQEQLVPGVHIGKEFSYLNLLQYCIFSLVIREKLLPSRLSEEAIWEPLLIGEDKARFAEFARKFPSVCRALTTAVKKADPPAIPPETLLQAYMQRTIDFLVKKGGPEIPIRGTTIHDRSLKALLSSQHSLEGSHSELATLEDSLKEWKKPLERLTSAPFKFCFRLEEPQETTPVKEGIAAPASPWKISYFLQAYDHLLEGAFTQPSKRGMILKGLGKFPFWRGEVDLEECLIQVYRAASDSVANLMNQENKSDITP